MTRPTVRPILISADEDGAFRITLRETRFNSQNYPLVTSTLQVDTFATVRAARAHARTHFGAEASAVSLV